MEKVKCFRCWKVGHLKWECPNIEVEKKKRKKQYMQPDHKRHSKKEDQYVLYRKRCRNIVGEEYAPQRCTLARKKMDNKRDSGNIYGLWSVISGQ